MLTSEAHLSFLIDLGAPDELVARDEELFAGRRLAALEEVLADSVAREHAVAEWQRFDDAPVHDLRVERDHEGISPVTLRVLQMSDEIPRRKPGVVRFQRVKEEKTRGKVAGLLGSEGEGAVKRLPPGGRGAFVHEPLAPPLLNAKKIVCAPLGGACR